MRSNLNPRLRVVCAAIIAAAVVEPGIAPMAGFDDNRAVAAEPHLPEAGRVGAIHRGADGQIELIDPTEGSGVAGSPCAKGTICVGKGQAYETLAAALAMAREGDTVDVIGGVYRESVRVAVKNLTLRGVGGQPHFDCAGLHLVGDKACLLLSAGGITLENIEISGAALPESAGANGACVRNDPNVSFTLRRVVCHGSQDGILSDGGTIVIENSEFFDNGWTDLTHNAYLGGNCSVTVLGSTFRDARVGHEFKSRCVETTISDSTFRSSKGSRDLDLPDGGEVKIYRSTLEKTRGAANHEIIGFTAESCKNPGDLLLKDSIIVNDEPNADLRNYDRCTGHPMVLSGVTVKGFAPKEYGYIKTE